MNRPADEGKLIAVLLKVCRGRELPGYMGGRSRPRTGPPRGNSLRRNDSSSMTSHCSHDLSHTDDGLPNRPDRALDNRHSKEHEPATGASCQRSRKLSSPIFRKDGQCRTGPKVTCWIRVLWDVPRSVSNGEPAKSFGAATPGQLLAGEIFTLN